MTSFSADDHHFMEQALDLAAQGLGRTWPNPSVGCLIVKNGHVLGQSRTADGGRPHAEPQALAQAGDAARGATAYVTLEPCNTHGKTPPCVDALIAAGVARVVIACADPYQERHGNGGIQKMMQAGIRVETGLLSAQATALNEGFFLTVSQKRPLIAVKMATTLDARIATKDGESKWITGAASRRRAHELRARHDAVLVGIGTVLADDPLLTVRLEGQEHQPVRVVIDRDLRIPPHAQLVATARQNPVWVICGDGADAAKATALEGAGVKILRLPHETSGAIPPLSIAQALAAEGLTRVMVEGGGVTIAGFLKAGIVDTLLWFRAPVLIGGDGVPAVGPLGTESLSAMIAFRHEGTERLGDDLLETWRRKD